MKQERPQSVPALKTRGARRKVAEFEYPDKCISTFEESSRFKQQKRATWPLHGPNRDYGQKRTEKTPDDTKTFYLKQKNKCNLWDNSSLFIRGYTGHIHGINNIEGWNFNTSSTEALRRNFSAGDDVKINRRLHMGKRSKTPENRGKRYHMRGYTGFIRGGQHIHGRTYKKTTEMALNRGYKEICKTSPLPCDPHCNFRIDSLVLEQYSPRASISSPSVKNQRYRKINGNFFSGNH